MYVPLDRGSDEPLSRQIRVYLEELIRRGHLPPGARLPSLRALARSLGVARDTIETAYDELAARALVGVVPGQGAIVRRKLPAPVALSLPFPEPRQRDPFSAGAWNESESASIPRIDLRGDGPPLLHAPTSALRRTLRAAVDTPGPILGGSPPGGEPALRRAASHVFAFSGVLRPPEEIVVYAGLGEAVRALVERFAPPGGLVLADGPLDPRAVRAVREAERRLLAVEPGTVAEALARRRAGGTVRLGLVPSDPGLVPRRATGTSPRRALLDAARDAGVPLVEDVTRSPVSAPGADDAPLASLDRSGRVLSLVDLSDEIGGGFDSAAIAATPKVVERLRARAAATRGPLDRLADRALAAQIEDPARARRLRALHERRALLAAAIARALARRLPTIRRHEFSSSLRALRLELPDGVAARDVARRAEARGVLVASAADCGRPREDDFLLLDLTRHAEGEILEGIRLLGAAIGEAEEAALIARSRAPEDVRS